MSPEDLAAYILKFLEERNGGELQEAFDNMRVADRRNLLSELALILKCHGKPPNWVN